MIKKNPSRERDTETQRKKKKKESRNRAEHSLSGAACLWKFFSRKYVSGLEFEYQLKLSYAVYHCLVENELKRLETPRQC